MSCPRCGAFVPFNVNEHQHVCPECSWMESQQAAPPEPFAHGDSREITYVDGNIRITVASPGSEKTTEDWERVKTFVDQVLRKPGNT